MLKIVLIFITVVLSLLFLAIYEGIFLLYYEETKSDSIVNYILVPVYVLILLFLIFTGGYLSYKKRNISFFGFIKEVGVTIFLFVFLHFCILQPSVSGLVQLINSIDNYSEDYILEGNVYDIYRYSGRRSSNFELTIIKENRELCVLDTKGYELDKYSIGKQFKRKVKMGCLGLIYEQDKWKTK